MLGLLTKLERVHEAVSREEREAVYALRYRVHVHELNRPYPDADHERRWLRGADDELPSTTIFYTGRIEQMTGTISVRSWAPGRVPADKAKLFSMARFPGIERLATAELGRLSVRPEARGKLIVPALLHAAYAHLAGGGADLVFCCAAPGLVRYYQKFGAVAYGGRLIESPAGPVQIPLVFVLSDIDHLKRVGSFLAPLAKKFFGSGAGRRAPLDTTRFRHLFEAEQAPVESDPAHIWEAMEASLRAEQSRTFVDVPSTVLRKLTRSGFLLELAEGERLLREGNSEQEVFVILEGTFEVFQGERRIALRSRGDVIGEIAFFTQAGQRTASVRALTPGRLLVLRRKFLLELTKSDPEAGFQMLMTLSRVMAERLSEMMRAS